MKYGVLWVIEHLVDGCWVPTRYCNMSRAGAILARRAAYPPNDEGGKYRVVKYVRAKG